MKRGVKNVSINIIKEIIKLSDKSLQELRELYIKLYDEPPYINIKQHLVRDIAYRLQELEYGFLSTPSAKKLEKVANDTAKGKKFGEIKYFKPIDGTRIYKDYNGKTYEVETASEGFICNGFTYKSLSSLASKITGHKTNGPKFFGIKKCK